MEESDEDIFSKVNRLEIEKKNIKNQIKEIQESCPHTEYKIELYKRELINVCKACGKKIGYPGEQEKKDSGYI